MNTVEQHVADEIRRSGYREAFTRLLAENDAWIRRPELGNGRQIVTARTAVFTGLISHWAAAQQQAFGYDKPFAVVALGGTGRAEMTPCSDLDFAFLFDDALEGNSFLLDLQRRVLHSDAFAEELGFTCLPLPFSLEDVPGLADKQLNSFLDMRPVYDPQGLADRFRERIRATFDPFRHFLHVWSFWCEQWEKAAGESERLDRFDIKNEGLRVFLAGIWTLAGKRFIHSGEVYETLEDRRDLEAYDFLLRLRGFVHLRHRGNGARRGDGNHPEDVLGFDDFIALGELLGPDAGERERFLFANEVRARLLAARRRVAQFAKGVIEQELKCGREVSPGNPIVFHLGGLSHTVSDLCRTNREKSQAAISLLLASQHYGVPVAPAELQTTFRNAGDWLVRTPELSALFYEQHGSLADSFEFLSQVEGAEERLFPGYAKFEASLDARVAAERKSLRSALERQKMRALEQLVRQGQVQLAAAVSAEQVRDLAGGVFPETEAALLDPDDLAAVKLALKTKRLPLTDDDRAVRVDERRPLLDRFSTGLSEIPLAEYYEPYRTDCEFTERTVRLVEFLIAHRRVFKEFSQDGINDTTLVVNFAAHCQDEQQLRALFVFTVADRTDWENERADPARWFNIRELYTKAMLRFRPGADPTRALNASGYSVEQLEILRDFGVDFFGGVYRQYANRFGAQLVRMVEEPEAAGPRAAILRAGMTTIIGVAARDYRGLAATISGAFLHHGIALRQAHLFSAAQHGLVLDFFHVAAREKPLPTEVTRDIEEAVQRQLYIAETDEASLPVVRGCVSIKEWRAGQYCLQYEGTEDVSVLIYPLAYKVFRHLGGNIFGLTARPARSRALVSVYLNLPPGVSLEQAQAIVSERF